MDIIIVPLILLAKAVLQLAYWLVIVYVILSLMCTFNVINLSNRFVAGVTNWIYRVVEPPLKYINKFVPPIGNIDISPVILLFALFFVDMVLARILLRF